MRTLPGPLFTVPFTTKRRYLYSPPRSITGDEKCPSATLTGKLYSAAVMSIISVHKEESAAAVLFASSSSLVP